jgi:penicillin-binding protein 1A
MAKAPTSPPGPNAARNDLPADARSIASSSAASQQAPVGSRWRPALRVLWRLAKWGSLVGLFCSVAAGATLAWYVRGIESQLPSVDQLRKGYDPPQVTRVLAADGALLANIFTERRTVVPIASLPPATKVPFLAAEDASFYEHEGLNYLGIMRAMMVNLRAGRTVQGGSTITQQVVKNVLLHSERSYERKIKETLLARRLEQHLSKDEIFGLYLNHIYLGHGRYGIEEAARYYFGKPASQLELAESALLAGIVASPEHYSPRRRPDLALQRRAFVLKQMLAKGFATQQAYEQASGAPLNLAPAEEEEPDLAPEAVAQAKELLASLDPKGARRGGFTIQTTLDPRLQLAAREFTRSNAQRYAKRHQLLPPYRAPARRLWGPLFSGQPKRYGIYVGKVVSVDDATNVVEVAVGTVSGRLRLDREPRYNPEHLAPSRFTAVGAALRVALLDDPAEEPHPALRLELGPQTALVSVDLRTRAIVALIGSVEGIAGGLDRASRARRQPGSTFKPVLYSYALHQHAVTAATVFDVVSPTDNGLERVRLRSALARSLNPVAEQLIDTVGPQGVVQWAAALGIESKLGATRSLALGAYEVSALELSRAYATMASGGVYAHETLISSITGPGSTALTLPAQPPTRPVMTADEAFLITSLLTSVIQEGTAVAARGMGRPLAGKTGTTNDAKDAWFAGFSTDLVTIVWVGYDDALPLGPGESGASAALPLWIDFMKAAHRGRTATEFPRPGSILMARIDPLTGALAPPDSTDGSLEEFFLEGTLPVALPADAALGAGPTPQGLPSDATSTATSAGGVPALPADGDLPAGGQPPPVIAPPPTTVPSATSESPQDPSEPPPF